jgi:hypothetical protein
VKKSVLEIASRSVQTRGDIFPEFLRQGGENVKLAVQEERVAKPAHFGRAMTDTGAGTDRMRRAWLIGAAQR